MSVLIKGLKMPKNCMECPFKGFDRAKGKGNICTIDEEISLHAVLDGLDVKFLKMGDCPLIELPDHGDLIDRDKVREKAHKLPNGYNHGYFHKCVDELFDYAPVVIPAERSEE